MIFLLMTNHKPPHPGAEKPASRLGYNSQRTCFIFIGKTECLLLFLRSPDAQPE